MVSEITIPMFYIELETQPKLASEMVLLGSTLIREACVRIRMTACEQNGVRSWIFTSVKGSSCLLANRERSRKR